MKISQCDRYDLPGDMVRRARLAGAEIDFELRSSWVIFRATWENETVGFVGLLCRTPSVATIRGWYVEKKFRGQGIGTALLEAAMTYALEAEVDKLEIRTAQNRIAQRAGFEWTGYQRRLGNQERHYVFHRLTREA